MGQFLPHTRGIFKLIEENKKRIEIEIRSKQTKKTQKKIK